MVAKGIYPSMTVPDIISALEAWGLAIEEERLARPTPEFVEGVFCACLAQVTGINREDLLEPSQEALSVSSIDEKDIYLFALTNNLLLHHLTRFANAARVDDFSAIDLTKPTRERTIILLSAFINFVKFTEQLCEPFIKELTDRSEALLNERDQTAVRLLEIQKQIQDIKAKIAEDEPLCEQLRAENNTLRSQLLETKQSQQADVQEIEQLKAEKSELIKRKESLTIELEAISDANRRIRGRIVQSPERVKRGISTMGNSAIEYKKTVVTNEARARDLQAKINALVNIEADLRSCIDQLQVVEKETKTLQDVQKDLAELKDQLDDKNIERNELQLKQERVDKQLENAHAKLALTQKRAADKKAANTRVIERLQAEYDEMDGERKENDLQLAEVRREATEVEEKISEHLKASEEEIGSLLKEYWGLRRATDVYMETLANKLNMRVNNAT